MKTVISQFVLLILLLPMSMLAAETEPVPQPVLQAIRYERTGGFVSTDDVIEITSGGAVVVQGRLMSNAKGQLKPEQIAKLISLFTDWSKLKSDYPARKGSADGFNITIHYGMTAVSGSETNASLPASFTAARSALEKIARDLARK
ncbi:MAG: hypothetical protein WCN98_02980 [Verrucomicrobiaceae bacterium]